MQGGVSRRGNLPDRSNPTWVRCVLLRCPKFLARFLLTFPNVFPTNTKAWHDHVFKFESGKTFVANSAEYQTTHLDTAAQVSSKGDSYITVFYNDAPDKIILLYSTKMFVYKE